MDDKQNHVTLGIRQDDVTKNEGGWEGGSTEHCMDKEDFSEELVFEM